MLEKFDFCQTKFWFSQILGDENWVSWGLMMGVVSAQQYQGMFYSMSKTRVSIIFNIQNARLTKELQSS